MSAPNAIRIGYDLLRAMDSSDITTVYKAIPTRTDTAPLTYTLIPFPESVRIIQIKNDTDTNLLLSTNGYDDHDMIAANSHMVLDFGSNKSSVGGLLEMPAGGYLFVRYDPTAPYYQTQPLPLKCITLTVIYASTD